VLQGIDNTEVISAVHSRQRADDARESGASHAAVARLVLAQCDSERSDGEGARISSRAGVSWALAETPACRAKRRSRKLAGRCVACCAL